jgi:hypothetical protein
VRPTIRSRREPGATARTGGGSSGARTGMAGTATSTNRPACPVAPSKARTVPSRGLPVVPPRPAPPPAWRGAPRGAPAPARG